MIGDRVGRVVLTFNRRDEVLRTLSKLEAIECVDRWHGRSDRAPPSPARVSSPFRATSAPPAVMPASVRATLHRVLRRRYLVAPPLDQMRGSGTRCTHPSLAAVTARVLAGEDGREDPTSVQMAASPLPNTLGIRGSELVGRSAARAWCAATRSLPSAAMIRDSFSAAKKHCSRSTCVSAGWRMVYLPDAVVCHHPSALRDARERQRLALRNALWCAWLRRPLSSVTSATCRWWRHARRDGMLLSDASDALPGLAWVLGERRVVPAHVEAALRTIEAFYAGDRREDAAIAAGPRAAGAN